MQCALLNTPMATRQYVDIVLYLSNVQTLVRYTSERACKDWHMSIVSSPLGQRAEACLLTLTFVVVSTKTNCPFKRVISPTVRKQSPKSDTLSRTIGPPPYLTPSQHSPYLPARMDYSTGRRRLRFPIGTKCHGSVRDACPQGRPGFARSSKARTKNIGRKECQESRRKHVDRSDGSGQEYWRIRQTHQIMCRLEISMLIMGLDMIGW